MVAGTFVSTLKDLRRRGFNTEIFTEELLEELFNSLKMKRISKEAVPYILELISYEKLSLEKAIEKSGLKALTEEDLKRIIEDVFKKYPKLVKERKESALMGELMKITRGRIDGKIVAKALKESLDKLH